MRRLVTAFIAVFVSTTIFWGCANAQDNLRIIIIRHGEKPDQGENLNCQGINRSLKLPNILYSRFGKPDYLFVPQLNMGEATTHSRMYQTIVPFAIKYNVSINTSIRLKDSEDAGKELKKLKGTVLMVWEHNSIMPLVEGLDIDTRGLNWPDNDFDSIWIITFKNGKAKLQKDRENIQPGSNCSF